MRNSVPGSIYDRKKEALKKYTAVLKERGEEIEYIRHCLKMADEVLNVYMSGYQETRRCKTKGCGEYITNKNKTGYCRHCNMNKYRKKYKVDNRCKYNAAERARRYRKKRKLKALQANG